MGVSSNKFTLQNKLIEEQCRRELAAATVIKRNFIRSFWDPNTYLGRKRLERSLEDEEYSVWRRLKSNV